MFKLSAVNHIQKKVSDQDVERFLFRHPYMGIFLCGIVIPIFILLMVSILCFAVAIPISLFMGCL